MSYISAPRGRLAKKRPATHVPNILARAYHFDCAPELIPYLASVPPPQRLAIQGLRGG